MKTIVLGGGVIGVATAFHLREQGCDVTVIEREPDVALATSFGNAGVIAPGYVTPWAAPGMPAKILKYLFKANSPLIFRPTLDPAQYFGPSTASSSPGLVTFPAIEHLYLPIEIRMSSRPGVAYRSVGLIHLQATIFSWPPTGTLFPMITRFTLEDTRRPGVTVYSCRRFSLRF